MTADRLTFGIMGTGNIARQFVTGLQDASHARAVAVASRDPDRAAKFAQSHGIDRHYSDYQDLLTDPTVEAVYLSLPNHLHYAWTIRALEAGKHVLCEKPLAVTPRQVEQMFQTAERRQRRLMEGFMYLCHPLFQAVEREVRSGRIGELRLIRTSFSYYTRSRENNIRFSHVMAGGALMDIGCYCLSFAARIADAPLSQLQATARMNANGIDLMTTGCFRFENNVMGDFACGMISQTDNTAIIGGTDGYICIPIPWKPPASATYVIHCMTPPKMDGPKSSSVPPEQTMTVSADRHLFAMEADAFAQAVRENQPMPISPAFSLAVSQMLLRTRQAIGLRFQEDHQ